MRRRCWSMERPYSLFCERSGVIAIPLLREVGLICAMAGLFVVAILSWQDATTPPRSKTEEVDAPPPLSDHPIRSLSISQDEQRLWMVRGAHHLEEVDLTTDERTSLFESSSEMIVYSGHNADGRCAVLVLDDHQIRIIRDGEIVWVGEEAEFAGQGLVLAAISRDCQRIVLVYSRGAVKGFTFKQGPPTPYQFEFGRGVSAARMDQSGRRLFVAHLDGTLAVYNPRTGKVLKTFPDNHPLCTAMTLSADGDQLVTAGDNEQLRVWDTSNGRELWRSTFHGFGAIWMLAISPDKRWVAAGSYDKNIALWSSHAREIVRTLSGHHAPLRSLVFSSSSERLYSGSLDGSLRVWSIETGMQLREVKMSGTAVDR